MIYKITTDAPIDTWSCPMTDSEDIEVIQLEDEKDPEPIVRRYVSARAPNGLLYWTEVPRSIPDLSNKKKKRHPADELKARRKR
jgi:hypothetical protein